MRNIEVSGASPLATPSGGRIGAQPNARQLLVS
jgi:hypothetical protein